MRHERGAIALVLRATTWLVVVAFAVAGVLLAPSFAAAGFFAYVTGGNTVSVIATATNTVVKTIALGLGAGDIAITPDGAFAYVTGGNAVSVIATATNTVVATIPVGHTASVIAITPNGDSAYVAGGNSVSVIATATNTVVATIPVGNGPGPCGLAITPGGAFAYVTNVFDHTVSVIATETNTVIGAPIAVGMHPNGLAITPGGAFAYVANITSDNISVIATATNTVVATIPVERAPRCIAITPGGAFAYVTSPAVGVLVIATATNTVVGNPIRVGGDAIRIAITPGGAFAYVADHGPSTVSVIATATNTVVATIPVQERPFGVAITPFLMDVYACTGFAPPFDQPISLGKDRAIPLKMQLFKDGVLIDDLNIAGAVPVVNVSFSAGGVSAVDVTAQLEPLGSASEGNQFRFDVGAGQWVFNLGTKPFEAVGTYTVTVAAGDTSYSVSPTCIGQFVRPE